jgi:hypothetical protein
MSREKVAEGKSQDSEGCIPTEDGGEDSGEGDANGGGEAAAGSKVVHPSTCHDRCANNSRSNQDRETGLVPFKNYQMCKHLPRVLIDRLVKLKKRLASNDDSDRNGSDGSGDYDYVDAGSPYLLKSPLCQFINNASVMIADVSGFTALSEKFSTELGDGGAEQITFHINAYFTILLEVISKRGGDVIKFSGDAIIVLFKDDKDDKDDKDQDTTSTTSTTSSFSSPSTTIDDLDIDNPDSAVHAVQCGLDLQENGIRTLTHTNTHTQHTTHTHTHTHTNTLTH